MRRKNWAIPGFLMLVILLLFSFCGTAMAEDAISPDSQTSMALPAQTQEDKELITPDLPKTLQASPSEEEPKDVLGTPTDLKTAEESIPPALEQSTPTESDTAAETVPTASQQSQSQEAPEAAIEPEGSTPAVPEQSTPAESDTAAETVPTASEQSQSQEAPEPVIQPEGSTPAVPEQCIPAVPEQSTPAGPDAAADTTVAAQVDQVDQVMVPSKIQNTIKPAPVILVPKSDPSVKFPMENQVEAERPNGTGYVVKKGDTLKLISEKTGVTAEQIRKANNMDFADDTPAQPASVGQNAVNNPSGQQSAPDKIDIPGLTYIVRKGESLWLIGRNLGVSYLDIMRRNKLVGDIIYPDQELTVEIPEMTNGMFKYRIKDGDTLYFIGKALGLNYEDIMSLNGLTDIWIYNDQELKLPDQQRVNIYRVRDGDTLAGVAERFNIKVDDILGSSAAGNSLTEGQVLMIPREKPLNKVMKMAAASLIETDSDLELLARAINGEARGEVFEGKVAVGAVIMNRLKDRNFPKTIRDIIFQPGAFTAVDDGQINLQPDSSAIQAAQEALAGADPSLGAIYYWNPQVATSKWIWTRPINKQIGNHVFAK